MGWIENKGKDGNTIDINGMNRGPLECNNDKGKDDDNIFIK